MRGLMMALLILLAGTHFAAAASLDVAHTSDQQVSCLFDLDCLVVVNDLSSQFTLPNTHGYGTLQSRRYPAGQAGTVAEGLYAYIYRIDLGDVYGFSRAATCISQLSLDFGPVTELDYEGDRDPDHVFVWTSGGLGSVAPSAASESNGRITFTFDTPVCPGQSSFFFGLASRASYRTVNASLRYSLKGFLTVDAWAPRQLF
jgi:hypothetical protein